jgi:cytochrome c biogenesis protein CcmG, thiol:disulfide interchange protein DsbE
MNSLQEKYGSKNLKIVAISVDKKIDDANRFLKDVPAKFAVAFDDSGATARAYAVKAIPSSFLIGPDGYVQFAHQGFKSSDKSELEARILRALEQK